MANQQLFDYPGIIETIEADFNNETGNIAFRATFPNPKALLRHGETGIIQMTAPLKNALIIPQKATFEVLEKKYVFVITKDETVEQREISVVAEMPDIYVVSDGLQESDKILLEGIRKVSNHDKIKFEYLDPQKVISTLNVYAE
jgi:membrane fusion protein (multidrug efflux system)